MNPLNIDLSNAVPADIRPQQNPEDSMQEVALNAVISAIENFGFEFMDSIHILFLGITTVIVIGLVKITIKYLELTANQQLEETRNEHTLETLKIIESMSAAETARQENLLKFVNNFAGSNNLA